VPRSTVISGIAAIVMFVMMLSPLISFNAPAASAQQRCPDGQVWSESQGKCVQRVSGPIIDVQILTPTPDIPIIPEVIEVEPTVRVVETVEDPNPEATVVIDEDTPILIPTETMEPADEGETTILINKHLCPVGFDAASADASALATTCVDNMDGVTFNISDGASNIASQQTNQYQPHVAYFQHLPIGPLSIVEVVPAGFDAPIVLCDEHADGAPIDSMSFEQVLDGNQIFHLFQQPGQVLYCDWYNVPSGDATPTTEGDNTVIVNKHGCPVGYDAAAADIYDLAANCGESQEGITFNISDGASNIASDTTGVNSLVQFEELPVGPLSIVEIVPAGYGAPIVFCGEYPLGDSPLTMTQEQVLDGNQIFHLFQGSDLVLYCDWFNVPTVDNTSASLIIYKHGCPDGYQASADLYDLTLNCQESMDGVNFILSDGAQAVAEQMTGDVIASGISIDKISGGPYSIVEQVPAGYMAPYVFCGSYSDKDPNPAIVQESVLDGNQIFHIFEPGETLICDWFNVPMADENYEPGEVTIYKHTCPAGYNYTALGAQPWLDCANATNGVTFTLDGPNGYHTQTNTGDSIDGAVYFGGLEPGSYQANELLPDGIADAFVWDCTGGSIGMIQDHPISTGTSLDIPVAYGDQIICNWYNVPEYEIEAGQIHLIKYACIGNTFTSPVNCEIYEGGATFDLLYWNGTQWASQPNYTGQTNVYGELSWTSLPPNSYQIDETSGEPCYITSDHQDGQGNISVVDGQVTTVKVYNCGYSTSTPVKPGKPTTKYPNTGVAPVTAEPTPAAQEAAEGEAPIAGFDVVEDVCTKVEEATPEPDATPEPNCDRGAVPASIVVETIDVDAEIEILETVNGTMQAPSDENIVSWYKETARLGEDGNVVLAGHLNYWGVPQAVFFAIDTLQEGDVISVTGEDGEVYEYEVQWVQQLDAFASPDEAVAPTGEESLTLITCGGEWNAAASEYDHRTVVRAVRINAE
jgi:LPXTG-site transpeptidase (sortase) family protein